MQTDTQQGTKDRIVAALIMNGWQRLIEVWFTSFNESRHLAQDVIDRTVAAYLDRMADDISEALVNGHYPDGTVPRPAVIDGGGGA